MNRKRNTFETVLVETSNNEYLKICLVVQLLITFISLFIKTQINIKQMIGRNLYSIYFSKHFTLVIKVYYISSNLF